MSLENLYEYSNYSTPFKLHSYTLDCDSTQTAYQTKMLLKYLADSLPLSNGPYMQCHHEIKMEAING